MELDLLYVYCAANGIYFLEMFDIDRLISQQVFFRLSKMIEQQLDPSGSLEN